MRCLGPRVFPVSDLQCWPLHSETSQRCNWSLKLKFTYVLYTLRIQPQPNFMYYILCTCILTVTLSVTSGTQISTYSIRLALRKFQILEFFRFGVSRLGELSLYYPCVILWSVSSTPQNTLSCLVATALFSSSGWILKHFYLINVTQIITFSFSRIFRKYGILDEVPWHLNASN